MRPITYLLSSVVHFRHPGPVMVNGEFLMRGRKILELDEAALMAKGSASRAPSGRG